MLVALPHQWPNNVPVHASTTDRNKAFSFIRWIVWQHGVSFTSSLQVTLLVQRCWWVQRVSTNCWALRKHNTHLSAMQFPISSSRSSRTSRNFPACVRKWGRSIEPEPSAKRQARCRWCVLGPERLVGRSAGHTPTHSSFPIPSRWHGGAQTSGGRFPF